MQQRRSCNWFELLRYATIPRWDFNRVYSFASIQDEKLQGEIFSSVERSVRGVSRSNYEYRDQVYYYGACTNGSQANKAIQSPAHNCKFLIERFMYKIIGASSEKWNQIVKNQCKETVSYFSAQEALKIFSILFGLLPFVSFHSDILESPHYSKYH